MCSTKVPHLCRTAIRDFTEAQDIRWLQVLMRKIGLVKLTQAIGDIMEDSQLPRLVESVQGTQLRSNVAAVGNLEDDVVDGGKGLCEARNYDRSGVDPTHDVRHVTTGAGFHDVPFKEEGRSKSLDQKSTRLNSSHLGISYAVFCL